MADGYQFETLKEQVRNRLPLVPPFTRRPLQVPFRLAHPVWIEDPHFDLDNHVFRVGAPAPGGRRELADLAGQIASTPLPKDRPLWQIWVIEGLKHDRIGVVAKVHHSAIDGASGAEIMVRMFDFEPDAPQPPPPDEVPEPDHVPNDLELFGYAVASRARRLLSLPRLVAETTKSISRIVEGRRDPLKPVGAVPLSAPRTPWNGSLTPHRSVAFARVPLDEAKEVKNTFGCTLNDVVLAICAGTLRRYLVDHGGVPEQPLIAAVPVSVRTESSGEGNQVSIMFTSLATDLDDPVERLLAIHETTIGAKAEHEAANTSTLLSWMEFTGPNSFNLASRVYSGWKLADTHRPLHNVIISNVPGPPFPLYFGGAEMLAAYPFGPIMEGAGLNITVFSYRDSIDIGFKAGRELVPDLWDMVDEVNDSFAELLDAARAKQAADQPVPASANGSAKAASTNGAATSTNGATKSPAPTGTTRTSTSANKQTSTNGAKTSSARSRTTKPATSTATTAKKRTPRKRTTPAKRRAPKRPADAS
jgi:WS/DGAT/MGAT family acyltransferase